jgi:hypothetical protein
MDPLRTRGLRIILARVAKESGLWSVVTVSSWWRGAKKKLRQGRVRLLRSPGAPGEVAGGMALGLFIAVLPILGLQLPLALLIAEALRRLTHWRLSRVAAATGVWLNNPVTAAPLYGLCYVIGRPIARLLLPASQERVGSQAGALDLSTFSFTGPGALEVMLGLVIGGVLLGVPIAWAGHRLTHGMVMRYHTRREERRARRAHRVELATEA